MIPIDAHVHFHRREWVEPTLSAATKNFAALAAIDSDLRGVLLLAQTRGEKIFEWLRQQLQVGAWHVDRIVEERQSLWLTNADHRLLVVCGRQIQAERGLEVLALGTDEQFDEQLGLESTLELVRASRALPVLPWGFGKWTGDRGRRIQALLAKQASDELWLGDNGGRLRNWRRPLLLEEGERHGVRILPGTDPFPFGADYRRVGSFGCLVPGPLDSSQPWASICMQLRHLDISPSLYGRCSRWLRFGFNQAWMQVHMRLRDKTA